MKLWKGRFSKAATSSADEFNASIEFDQRLYREDITGSIAHARMLGKQGIITPDESLLIVETLQDILKDIEEGKVEFTIESEDIHMNIESILTERIGDVGKKLHTARSRNDQVAVDIRLYLKKETAAVRSVLTELERRAGKTGEGTHRYCNARLYPFTACSAGDPGLPSVGLLSDVLQRHGKIRRLSPKDRQAASGQRRPCRHQLTIPTEIFWQKSWVLPRCCPMVWMRWPTETSPSNS